MPIETILKEKYKFSTETDIKNFSKIINFIGIKEKALESFLSPSLKNFHHPFEMKDMEIGVDLLLEMLDSGKKILFYGDYDADGITTTSLFITGLKELGYTNIDWFIPNRHIEGYGVDKRRVETFVKEYDLIVTGDTGIREIETLQSLPIPVIVTDHHEPIITENESELKKYSPSGKIIKEDKLNMIIPAVEAVINPKRIDCPYKNKCLSGVAVIFKMLQGIYIKKSLPQADLLKHLDLVALGLVADLVPQFDKENQDIEVRLMTALGLQVMNANPKSWLQSLMDISGKETIQYTDLGFFLGPRLNAPGRLGSPNIAVEFLLEEDIEMVYELSEELEEINTQRKNFQQRGVDNAKEKLNSTKENVIVVRLDKEFHSGIAGLVASGLVQQFNVPVIVLCEKEVDGELFLTGSCRSIEGVSILSILEDIERKKGTYKFGGHAAAAGLTIEANDYEDFKKCAIESAKGLNLDSVSSKLFYEVDVPLDEVSLPLINFTESTFHQIRFHSPKNKFYSIPSPRGKPEWATLYLSKGEIKHQAALWSGGSELIKECSSRKINEVDIVYKVGIFRDKISVNVENYLLY